jgi:hypothetical protein
MRHFSLCLLIVAAGAPSLATAGPAASAPAAPAAVPAQAASDAVPEPKVVRTVIKEDGTRIEELRVRGQVQSIDVHAKAGAAFDSHYQVQPMPGYHDPSEVYGPGAAGRSLWHTLSF